MRVRGTPRAKPPEEKSLNQEETMRKSLILFLAAIGSGAGYAAGVTDVGKDLDTSDPATWRWHGPREFALSAGAAQPHRCPGDRRWAMAPL